MNANLLSRLFIAWLTCLAALLFAPILLAAEAEKAPPVATEDNTLSIHIDDMLQPWKGDLPGMTERRTIRVLTTYSKTFFFIDKGTQRGATHDIFMALENDLNKQLAKDKKLKQRHLKMHTVFVPVSRDNLFMEL
ncbi:lytic transglycosylase F, partial [Escherichia coli]|nr:lytic transglycosylase F [Escherichia coli]